MDFLYENNENAENHSFFASESDEKHISLRQKIAEKHTFLQQICTWRFICLFYQIINFNQSAKLLHSALHNSVNKRWADLKTTSLMKILHRAVGHVCNICKRIFPSISRKSLHTGHFKKS